MVFSIAIKKEEEDKEPVPHFKEQKGQCINQGQTLKINASNVQDNNI